MARTDPPAARVVQPYLHELVSCLAAPTVVLSGPDGQIRAGSVHGLLQHDTRMLSELVVTLDGHEPEPVGHTPRGASGASFVAVARHLGDPDADPTVRLVRERHVDAAGACETLTVHNDARTVVRTRLTLHTACDLATVFDIKHGVATTAISPTTVDTTGLAWSNEESDVRLTATPAASHAGSDGDGTALAWDLAIESHASWQVIVTVRPQVHGPALFHGPQRTVGADAAAPSPWSGLTVTAPDRDLSRLVRQSLTDLAALQMTTVDGPDTFLAAGSPWFFTLFGRDSLWAARMLLPLGTDLARGTLRILARRQGKRHDPRTAEAPGKILHEVRRPPSATETAKRLPPLYYGTIDATALWVCLLHDAWRWGMSTSDVADLAEPLEAALGWLVGAADADGDGFLEYLDHTGEGLANQGWKDSGDAIQRPDGTIAKAPIALCEAQAYAHEAVVKGAVLLEALGRSHADRYRGWAADMRELFRSVFWVSDDHGAFPALALDGDKAPVATPTSNLGHLLGTGLLDPAEAALVADRLGGADLDCGYGLRTMTGRAKGFNPLGYHAGTVWPHDTAIAILGLAREGRADVAASLAAGLLAAAPHFAYRLPELFAGTDGRAGDAVLAYPASCRPQAWSAASAVVLLQAALGLEADVPAGVLLVRPDPAFARWFPLQVHGLQVAGRPLSIDVDGSGSATVTTDAPVTVIIGAADRRS